MFELLKDKTVLITGASSGIGAAIANEYIKVTNGQIKLVLTARRTQKIEESFKDSIEEYSNLKLYIASLDVSDIRSRLKFWENIPDEFKNIDILINNAGMALGSELVSSLVEKDVEAVYQTNVLGMIGMTKLAVADMLKRGSGDIVQIGSIAGRDTYPSGSIYCSTKAAVKSFTDALRKEMISTPIRVIEIAPGNTSTEFALVRSKGKEDLAAKANEGLNPLKPQDVAQVIVFATSREPNTVLAEVVIMPTRQAGPNHSFRG